MENLFILLKQFQTNLKYPAPKEENWGSFPAVGEKVFRFVFSAISSLV